MLEQQSRHTLRTKSCCFQAAVQWKDVESKGTRLATATLAVVHESVDDDDSWWLSATQNPSRESSSRRTERVPEEAAIVSGCCC